MVSDPRRPDPVRTFLTPRVPGPVPTPEEVDFGLHLLPEKLYPPQRKTPQSLYIADVLKKIRQKYAPGEARRQLRRDYESKLGRRSDSIDNLLHSNMVNGMEYVGTVPREDPDYLPGLEDLSREQEVLIKKELRTLSDKALKSLDLSHVPWIDAKSEVERELLRRKAVRGLQLIGRDDIPRRGLLKMAASQLPVVKQGQQVLGMAEKASPTLVKALKAILSRKFRSM